VSQENIEQERIRKIIYANLDRLFEELDNLKSETNGGLYQEEKREKVKNFLPGQVKNSIL
jgi:hypothetical protein